MSCLVLSCLLSSLHPKLNLLDAIANVKLNSASLILYPSLTLLFLTLSSSAKDLVTGRLSNSRFLIQQSIGGFISVSFFLFLDLDF